MYAMFNNRICMLTNTHTVSELNQEYQENLKEIKRQNNFTGEIFTIFVLLLVQWMCIRHCDTWNVRQTAWWSPCDRRVAAFQ